MISKNYFACSCGDGAEECKYIRDIVKELLETDDSNLVTRVVYSLNWDFEVEILGIPCDMWSAIISAPFGTVLSDEQPYRRSDNVAYIQCDSIEDGFAATWLYWYEKFEKEK